MSFGGAFSQTSTRRRINEQYTIELFDEHNYYKPGPGQHEPSFADKPGLPQINFTKLPRQELYTKSLLTPAPGHTQPSLGPSTSGPAYSLRAKPQIKAYQNNNFGYQVQDNHKGPSYTMPHNNKDYRPGPEDHQKIGPGEYYKEPADYSSEIDRSRVDYASLKHLHTSRKHRHSLDQSLGSHNHLHNISHDFQDSSGLDKKSFRVLNYSGSGLNSSSLLKGQKILGFGNQQRFPKEEVRPGPHDYDVLQNQERQSVSKSYTMQKQYKSQVLDVPGPTDYHSDYPVKSTRIPVGFTGQARPDLFYIDEAIPAPNKYKPENKDSKFAITFLKTKRKEFGCDKKTMHYPGPEKYKPEKQARKIQYSIGKQAKQSSMPVEKQGQGESQLNRSMPGVGEYDLAQDILPAQHFHMPTRYNDNTRVKREPMPGPSDYVQQEQSKVRHGTINRRTRFLEEKKSLGYEEGTPGPGHYRPPSPKVRVPHSSTFGRHNKIREINAHNNPIGPGSYDINIDFNKMPAYALKGNKLNNFGQ